MSILVCKVLHATNHCFLRARLVFVVSVLSIRSILIVWCLSWKREEVVYASVIIAPRKYTFPLFASKPMCVRVLASLRFVLLILLEKLYYVHHLQLYFLL